MYVKVRTVDGITSITVTVSKLTTVIEFRNVVERKLGVKREKQRLFYRGKQLEDGYRLFDYDIKLNDVILLMIKADPETISSPSIVTVIEQQEKDVNSMKSQVILKESKYYRVGDFVDVRNVSNGAWFEGKIVGILNRDEERDGEASRLSTLPDGTRNRNIELLRNDGKLGEYSKTEHSVEVAYYMDRESTRMSDFENSTILDRTASKCMKIDGEKCEEEYSEDCELSRFFHDEYEQKNVGNMTEVSKKVMKCSAEVKHTSDIECRKTCDLEENILIMSDEAENIPKKKDSEKVYDVKHEENCKSSRKYTRTICKLVNESLNDGSSTSIIQNEETIPENKCVIKKLEDNNFVYQVLLEFEDSTIEVNLEHLRPRARYKFEFNDLKINDLVMANYNIENPKCRGYWYDIQITAIKKSRTTKEIFGFIHVGEAVLTNCKIIFCGDIMKIEKSVPVAERSEDDNKLMQTQPLFIRENALRCPKCLDNPQMKCRECSCYFCGGKDDPASQILCDECNMAFHTRCLNPPLDAVPDTDEWYCPDCKNDENEIVKAGEKLKESKKKAKHFSENAKSTRDWGKGMACVGRTKECTLVPPNHYGPIPGVEVGTTWLYRVQVSESGVHRPPVGGIHGRESDGAYSIVLSGGYEDDVDSGNEFFYTGSGGRDLSGNKRTADQSYDQKLTRLNKALALNCNTQLNNKGAVATNWKGGKPVRVIRNYKLNKYSKFAPKIGNRYDGIYKVVKYYPQIGKSGFTVWRYLLRRDDVSPAPWTPQGKKFIKLHRLDKVEVPEGYIEASEGKFKEETSKKEVKTRRKESGKRLGEVSEDSGVLHPRSKRSKTVEFKLDRNVKKLLEKDVNTKLWDLCSQYMKDGKQKFLTKVAETFMCICCQELVCKPVTTICKHNLCKTCLLRSFAADVYSCPCCRHTLGENYDTTVNETLSIILCKLFPGYDHGR